MSISDYTSPPDLAASIADMAARISALERTRTIPTGSGAPSSSPDDGAQYGDVTTGNYYVRVNGAWVSYPRIVRGTVTSAGAVGSGSGFTATKNATGDYTVTFTTAFAVAPVVEATAGATSAFYVVKLFGGSAPTVSSFRALCFSPSTFASVDGEFTFTAVAQ